MFLFSGCGILDYHMQGVKFSAQKIQETREAYEKQYIGQNKSVLLRDFGKPKIRYNVNHQGIIYDEEWFCQTKKGFWESNVATSVWFAIKDDVVGYVYVW